MTRRQEIIRLLEAGEWSLYQLANHFKTTAKEILLDFNHIPLTIHPRKIRVRPAQCKVCGFVFKERSRFSRPTKCPCCKSESVSPPMLRITV